MSRSQRGTAKRAFDVVVATLVLIAVSPLLAAIAVAVRIGLGRPVLFRQQRPGLGGRPFTILKFRTMSDARDADGNDLPDEQRVTRLGWALRRTSLDELPELLNVLRGDMSLVGPRPLLMRYLPRYSPEQMRRHEVRPGITGLAQVNGRNAIGWPAKFELDVWYVDNHTLTLDCRILLRTIWKAFRGDGISSPGVVSAEEFMGEVRATEPANER